MSSTLYKNRYGIAVGVILIAFTLVVGVVVSFIYGYISETLASILISGVGALGTVSLVVLTFVTLQENSRLVENNRQLVEERIKQRKKPLQREVVQALELSEQIMESNRENILNGQMVSVDSNIVHTSDDSQPIQYEFNLNTYWEDINSTSIVELRDRDPSLVNDLRAYDSRINEMRIMVPDLLEKLDEPLAEFRRNTSNITEQHHAMLLALTLNRYYPDDCPDWWKQNRKEIIDTAVESVPELEEWHEQQWNIVSLSKDSQSKLKRVKRQIQSEYGISLNEE